MHGRRVLVTGGTKGIGRGIAAAFAAAGADVVITGRDGAAATTAAAELAAAGKVHGIAADVGATADVPRMVAEAVQLLGGLDVLCCNAGIFPESRLADLDAAAVDEVLGVNLRGTILSVVEAIPALRESGRGRVVVTSSITGVHTGYAGWSHYAASKAGQLGFVKSAALELAPDGITINALLPGNVRTEGVVELGQAYQDEMAGSIPMGRLATVDEIGGAAVFLASDQASFITGQGLVIDGGQVLPESLGAMAPTG
jgi:3-oxoacyl-[acyl-carrier protein] reductase